MRRLMGFTIVALVLFITWMMISTPTRGDYWEMIYPSAATPN